MLKKNQLKMKAIFFLTFILLHLSTFGQAENMLILYVNETVDQEFIQVGEFTLRESDKRDSCTFNAMVDQAKMRAQELDANVIKITKHKHPGKTGARCHTLKGVFYKGSKEKVGAALAEERELLKELGEADSPVLYAFRPGGQGALIGYRLNFDQLTLAKMRSNTKYRLILPESGEHRIWGATETEDEEVINFQPGEVYYVYCYISMGAMVGRPQLELIDPLLGRKFFDSIPGRFE